MQTVLKLCDSYMQVEQALHFLRREGYVMKQINLIAPNEAVQPALSIERGGTRRPEGISDLARLGMARYPDERVIVVGSSAATAEATHDSFEDVLTMLGVPQGDVAGYSRAVRDGKLLLCVRIAAEQESAVHGILDQPEHPDFARGMHPDGDEKPEPDYARGMHPPDDTEDKSDFARGMHPDRPKEPGPDFARGMHEDERNH